MVAIVSGNTLGLSLTSLATLGQRGISGSAGQGRGGELVYVNAANGNLVLQSRDELLAGRGRDAASVRTYNSQGQYTDDNGDNWSHGIFLQQLQLSGTRNTVGSTLVRTDRDGAQAVYTFDAGTGRYVSAAGSGAFDTMEYDAAANQYAWTDGNGGDIERYDAATGRLLQLVDTSGNAVSYAYDAGGRLASITTASGETTYLDYSGNNISQLRTVLTTAAGTETLTRMRYTYDTDNRLASVIVDLSPEDNAVEDGNVYVTSYTYDGTSKRVASVIQSDGTSLGITYVQAGGTYRVATLTDGEGQVTSFAYDTANGLTTVTDPLSLRTVYAHDTAGRLLSVTAPTVGGVSQVSRFGYDTQGNLIRVEDPSGRVVVMAYDDQGNQVLQRDGAGNTLTRSYDAHNQLLTETVYLVPDADGGGAGLPGEPRTTRYVYDAAGRNQLRFVITAEGSVTEQRYDAFGNGIETLTYADTAFDPKSLAVGEVPSELDMEYWARLQDPSRTTHVARTFDFRGQVERERAFGVADANGVVDAVRQTTRYVYDQAGRLLNTIASDGGITSYTYDGLGRVLTVTDALDAVTLNAYDDANQRTAVTLANGLVTTSTFDNADRLVSVVQSSQAAASLGETRYHYDADGRLLMTTDPTGVSRWSVYDTAGRKVGDVDPDGTLTEYVYHTNNLLAGTIVHATKVNTAALVTAGGEPANVSLSAIRPANSTMNQREWRIYDAANRLVQVVDALGHVTQTRYDGASRVVSVTRYDDTVSVPASGLAPITSPFSVAPNGTKDRTTRTFYDADGRVVGEVDAENYYTLYEYDGAGRLSAKTRFASRVVGPLVNERTPPVVVPQGATAPSTAYVRPNEVAGRPTPQNIGDGTAGLVDAATLVSRLEAFKAVNEIGAFTDLVRLVREAHVTLRASGFDGLALLRQWVRALPEGSAVFQELAALGVQASADGTSDADLLVLGTMGNDYVNGGAGDDVIAGAEGYDELSGSSGDDTLDGGGGDDMLMGGSGSDTYLYGYGSGNDTISYEYEYDDGEYRESNVIQMGPGIRPQDVTLGSTEWSSRLWLMLPTGERLVVESFFNGFDGSEGQPSVGKIRFADGTEWGVRDILHRLSMGSSHYQQMTDGLFPGLIRGREGNDTLIGMEWPDEIYGGSRNDALYGREGSDLLFGGQGDDALYGGSGGSMQGRSSSSSEPLGLGDDDTLDGGAGDDYLYGESGRDVYIFGYGSGRDTIGVGGFDGDRFDDADTLRLGEGITPDDLIFSRVDGDLLISLRGSSDSILLSEYFGDIDGAMFSELEYARALEYIEFSDGTLWEASDIRARLPINLVVGGDHEDDTLVGGSGSDSIVGRAGDDTLNGAGGDDTLAGGAGYDVYQFGLGSGEDLILEEGWDNNRVDLGVPSNWSALSVRRVGDDLEVRISDADVLLLRDALYSWGPSFSIKFSDGVIWDRAEIFDRAALTTEQADDVDLRGEFLAEPLDGGAGADRLTGSYNAGDSIYGGSGRDTLDGNDGSDTLDGGIGNDHLWGGSGADVYRFSRGGGHDTIHNWSFSSESDGYQTGDVLQFGPSIFGYQVSAKQVGQDLVLSLIGTDDSVTLADYYGDVDVRLETIRFADGSTWSVADVQTAVQASSGPPAGSDLLTGTSAQEVFSFSRGFGSDTITGFGTTPGALDQIRLGSGILPSDVKAKRVGDTLILVLKGTADRLEVPGYFANRSQAGSSDPEILFGTASSWSYDLTLAQVETATSGDDRLEAHIALGQLLQGGAGDDTLIGRAGADTLVGGGDDDLLDGGAGNDTYQFGRGSGRDTIAAGSGAAGDVDVVELGAGVTPEDVRIVVRNGALVVTLRGSRDQLVIESKLPDGSQGDLPIQSFRFQNGTVWNESAIRALATTATALEGNIEGFDFGDTLTGSMDSDTLEAFGGDDVLLGGLGDDELDGGDGDDTLDGGAGDDYYVGEAGHNTYRFGRGAGHDWLDRIEEGNAFNVIEFAPDIRPSDVVVILYDGEFQIRIADTGDRIGGWSYSLPDELRFADGTVWDSAAIEEAAGHSTWTVEREDEVRVWQDRGDDVFRGVSGQDDEFEGGAGEDVFHFGRGSGWDRVGESTEWSNGDVIQLGAGVGPGDLVVWAPTWNSDLNLTLRGSDDTLSIGNFLGLELESGPAVIRFADGTEWTRDDLLQRLAQFQGEAAPVNPLVDTTSTPIVFRRDGKDLEITGQAGQPAVRLGNWYINGTTHVDQFGGAGVSILTTPIDASTASAALAGADQTTRLIYDSLGQLVGEIDAENYVTEHVYDASGRVTQTIRYSLPLTVAPWHGMKMLDIRPSYDGRAQVTSRVYDVLGRLTQETNPEGAITAFTYDAVGNLVSTTRGVSTEEVRTITARYDLQGRLVGELSGEGSSRITEGMTAAEIELVWAEFGVEHAYDAAGRRASTTDANGNKTVFYYDEDGRLRFTVNARGEVEERKYNALNQLETTVRLYNRVLQPTLGSMQGGVLDGTVKTAIEGRYDLVRDSVTGYTYTVRGQVATTTDALNNTSGITYNAFGEVETTTGADGLKTEFDRDRRGLVSSVVADPEGEAITTRSDYDAFGRVVRSVDGNGFASQQAFDRLGRVVQTLDPTNARRSSTWDAFDRKLTQTDALGNTTTYEYVDEARSMTVRTPEGVTVTTVHNIHGETSSVSGADGYVTWYVHDRDGRLTHTIDALDNDSRNEYDAGGRLTVSVDARGVRTEFVYDAANRVFTRTVDPQGLALTTTYDYDGKGQVRSVTDPRGTVTTMEYDRVGRVLTQIVDPSDLHIETNYTYDEVGRTLTFTDPNRVRTTYRYDSLGRRTSETRESGEQGLPGLFRMFSYDANGNLTTSGGFDVWATDENDAWRVSMTAYGPADRPIFTTDLAGRFTFYEYDAEGRITRTTRFAKVVDFSSLDPDVNPVPSSLSEALDLFRSPGLDVVQTNRYDRDGRLHYTVDGTGAVVEFRYDNRGNVSERIAYANAIDLATWDGSSDPAPTADSARDQRTLTRYDVVNRAEYVVDASGAVTHIEYDETGNVTRRTEHAAPFEGGTEWGSYPTDLADRVTVFVYDAAGRLTDTTDPTGAVTHIDYDENGNVTARTQFAEPVDPGADPTTVREEAAGNRITRHVYDDANRLIYTADAAGYVTTTQYDDMGNVTSTTRWANRPTVFGQNPEPAAGLDQTTRFEYDKVNRLIRTTDARNEVESYTYNGFGDKTSFTNKKGSVWQYAYDAAGRLLTETAPPVTITEMTPNGTADLAEGQALSVQLVTEYEYDALGNLLRRTEAKGTSGERSTLYRYDAMGRQVGVTHPPVRVYNEDIASVQSNGASGLATRVESSLQALTTSTIYDVFGNAVANIDVAGNASYKVYDQANRVVYDVDALGGVTQYLRDTFGDAISVIRYADPVALPPSAPADAADALTSPALDAAVQAGSAAGRIRRIDTEYDYLGRALVVREPQTYTYESSSGIAADGSKVTRNEYDAFGHLVLIRSLRSGSETGGVWIDTYQYFDGLGHLVDTVDALGYRTTNTYDPFGNLASVTEYADPLSAGTWDLESAGTPAPNADKDRRVTYTYDALNRKETETRVHVAASSAAQAAAATSSFVNVTTTFGYDAVGNLTATTDALGNSTYSYYDALGRVTAVIAPARTGPDGQLLRPLTIFQRDVHGNVVVQIELAKGAQGAASEFTGVSTSTQIAALVGQFDAADRRTLSAYDLHGHVTQVTDAEGYSSFMSYTARGELAKSWRGVTSGAPVAVNGKLVADSTLFKVNEYDKLGRLVATYDPGTAGELQRTGGLEGWKITAQSSTSNDSTTRVKVDWSLLADPAGGSVRVELDYTTLVIGHQDPYGEWIGDWSVPRQHAQEFAANQVMSGAELSWYEMPFSQDHGISAVNHLRVKQLVGGVWVTLWDDTTSSTTPPSDTVVTSAPSKVKTQFEYNAFGEVIRKGLNDGWQEYFRYDAAGRLWATNSGDGIDRVFLYDLQGNRTAELSSTGSGGDNRDFETFGSAKAAAEWGSTRRSETFYDALGHVQEQRGAVLSTSGVGQGVRVTNSSVSAVAENLTIVVSPTDNTYIYDWNKVTLGWPDLTGLGAGDVRVDVEYLTAPLPLPYYWIDGSGQTVQHTAPVVTRSTTATFTSEVAKTGVTFEWGAGETPAVAGYDESTTWQFNSGGISTVSRVVVWKKDAAGDWKKISDGAPGSGGQSLDVSRPADATATLALEIRPSGSGGAWSAFPQQPQLFTDMLRFNLAALPAGAFEFRVTSQVGGGTSSTVYTGEIHADRTISVSGTGSSGSASRAVVKQTTDRWGNVLTMTDARTEEWLTTYGYNASNQLVYEGKPTGATGTGAVTVAETRVFYDALGQQVAVKDARGSINWQVLDAGGQLVEEHHADLGVVTHAYDAFGNKVRTINAEGNKDRLLQQEEEAAKVKNTTTFEYDKLGRLTTTRHATVQVASSPDAANPALGMVAVWQDANLVDRNTYDQAGRRLTQTTGQWSGGAGETLRYQYDLAGHVIHTTQPGGSAYTTRSVFDVQGRKTAEIDQNGKASTWTYDYFGALQERTDLGGAAFRYTYDHARQLVTTFSTRFSPVNEQLLNEYDVAGRLLKITDKSLKQVTEYAYDLGGRHVREKTTQDGVVYQDNVIAYDAMGRMRSVSDGRMSIDIQYDLVGNRTFVRTHALVSSLSVPGTDVVKDDERYFTYDAMNRQTGVEVGSDGQLIAVRDTNGNIIPGKSGHIVGYDLNGNRVSDTYLGNKVKFVPGIPGHMTVDQHGDPMWDPGTPDSWELDTNPATDKHVQETYEYDALNRLVSAKRDGTEVDHRRYDAVGRVISTGPENLPPGYAAAFNTGVAPGETLGLESRVNRYDENGRLVRQTVLNADRTVPMYHIAYTDYDAAGNLEAYIVTKANEYTNWYTYQHAAYDGYKESKVNGRSDKFYIGSSESKYDLNGNLIGLFDETKSENNRAFVNDVAGHALYVTQVGTVQRQVVVNGEVLGRYGVGINEMNPRLEDGNPRLTELADFNFGYQPITGNYPTASVGSYQVKAGDTLRSIAREAYGDEGQWYRIAETNGLSGDRDLRVGQTINLPSVVGTIRNNADTYKPYDPTKITGDRTPNMPSPGGGGCGGVGMILVAVVVIVVAAITQQWYLTQFATPAAAGTGVVVGTTGTVVSTGSFLASAAVGAAAGSVAGQLAAMAMGMQDRFDWKQVGLSALSALVTAGVGGVGMGAAQSTATAVVAAAVSNAVTQGIAVAVGLQPKFEWRNVAAAALGTAVGSAVSGVLNQMAGVAAVNAGANVVTNIALENAAGVGRATLTGIAAGLAAAAVRGGRVTVERVAADAFGNALGSSLAEQLTASEVFESAFRNPRKLDTSSGVLLASNTSGLAGLELSSGAEDGSASAGTSGLLKLKRLPEGWDLELQTSPLEGRLPQVTSLVDGPVRIPNVGRSAAEEYVAADYVEPPERPSRSFGQAYVLPDKSAEELAADGRFEAALATRNRVENARNRQEVLERNRRVATALADTSSETALAPSWGEQQNSVVGPINSLLTDVGVRIGRYSPVLGGAFQVARWSIFGEGTNTDAAMLAAGPFIGKLGRLGSEAAEVELRATHIANKPHLKFREVEVKPPEFNNLDDWYAYKEARSDGAKYLGDFVSNLKGNVRLTVQPEFRQGSNYGGALSYPAVPVGAERTFVGEMGLVTDSELFKTVFHEEMHVRLGRQAASGNYKALDLLTGPLSFEENYVEAVATRYSRMYQNKFGAFQH